MLSTMEPPETAPVQHQLQQQRHCWFFHNGGCRKGEECAFKHDVSLLSAEKEKGKGKGKGKKDKNKNNSNSSNLDIEAPICIFFMRGRCSKGPKCRFAHVLKGESKGEPTREESKPETNEIKQESTQEIKEDLQCSVCYETPSEFGILLDCSHVFCAPCAHTWNAKQRTCAVCRRPSPFVVSAPRLENGLHEKEMLIDEFRRKKGSIACRFFRRSAKRCPFGDKCLYAHNDATGKRKVGVRKPQLSRKLRRERSLMDHDSDGGGGGGDPIVFQDALMGLMTAMESLGLPMNNVQEVQQVLDVMRATDPNLMQRLSRMVRMAPGLFAGGPFRNAGMMDVDEFIHDQFEDGHHYGPFPPYGFHDFGYNNHDGDEDDNGDDYYTTDEEMNEYDTVD